ncbi:hypothetical protein SLA2020_258660 [Shorea laevis]
MAETSNGNHTVLSVRGGDAADIPPPPAEPSNGNHTVVSVRGGDATDIPPPPAASSFKDFDLVCSVPFMQKLMAEVLGTFFLIFIGCASVVVNSNENKVVTLPGIAIVWGLAVTTLIYSLGHVSGAHFNPAVTIAFASCKRFPLNQVPAYMAAQLLGSTLAAGTLQLLFIGKNDVFFGTSPQGSDLQGFVMEFIITFYLMFIVSGVATDNRAIGELAGLAVGSTVLIIVLFAGPITGASMNPARTLGPAIVSNHWKGIWIYLTSPILGAVSAAWVYNMLRETGKPFCEITKAASSLESASSR